MRPGAAQVLPFRNRGDLHRFVAVPGPFGLVLAVRPAGRISGNKYPSAQAQSEHIRKVENTQKDFS